MYFWLVQICATAASLSMAVSPLGDLKRMNANKSVGEFSHLPYLMMFSNCCSWVGYAFYISNVVPVGVTNATSSFLWGFVLLEYYSLCPVEKRIEVIRHSAGVLFVVFSYFYLVQSYCTDHHTVRSLLGVFCSTLNCISYISPLSTVKRVLETRSSASISLYLATAGLANGFIWVFYGFLVSDPYIIGPNALCAMSSGLQLFLLRLYPKSKSK
ncbi:unnamed protein product [Heterosigma akashiwo]